MANQNSNQSNAPRQAEPTPQAKIRRPRKWILIAAALILLFGAISRWTGESFHFTLPGTPEKKDVSALQEAVISCDIPPNLVPTWFLDGFEPSEPQIDRIEDHMDSIICLYNNSAEDRCYYVSISQYYDKNFLRSLTFEKDDEEVRQCDSNGRTFYIMSNLENLTATWSDGTFVVTISGRLELNEIKTILDSIEDG